jgi:hypothetical protein
MTSAHPHQEQPAPLQPEEFAKDLRQFTGTEHYYRHPLARRVVYTDGVRYFAEAAGAYWLIDILATELPKLAAKHRILFVHCVVKDGNARLYANEDSGKPNLWERAIDFTDCPEGDWSFYMADGGDADNVVILLSSEY